MCDEILRLSIRTDEKCVECIVIGRKLGVVEVDINWEQKALLGKSKRKEGIINMVRVPARQVIIDEIRMHIRDEGRHELIHVLHTIDLFLRRRVAEKRKEPLINITHNTPLFFRKTHRDIREIPLHKVQITNVLGIFVLIDFD